MTPIAELLDLPDGYGTPKKKLAWATVNAELERAKQYWLATVWYYGGSEKSVHHRIVLANPKVVMHLPDAFMVVIVEGRVRQTRPASNNADAYAQVLGLYPERVIAWTSYPTDATRFRF